MGTALDVRCILNACERSAVRQVLALADGVKKVMLYEHVCLNHIEIMTVLGGGCTVK